MINFSVGNYTLSKLIMVTVNYSTPPDEAQKLAGNRRNELILSRILPILLGGKKI